MRMVLAVLVLASVTGCAGTGGSGADSIPTSAASSTAAETTAPSASGIDAETATRLCDTMWGWYRTVTGRFNEMSDDARAEDDPARRRSLMLAAFDDFAAATEPLPEAVASTGAPAVIVDQVTRDVPAALAVVEDMRQALVDRPELDDERPQIRLSQLIVLMEKLVDLPKPEVSAATDPELAAMLRDTPSCQFAVKGVDDGVGRYNG